MADVTTKEQGGNLSTSKGWRRERCRVKLSRVEVMQVVESEAQAARD